MRHAFDVRQVLCCILQASAFGKDDMDVLLIVLATTLKRGPFMYSMGSVNLASGDNFDELSLWIMSFPQLTVEVETSLSLRSEEHGKVLSVPTPMLSECELQKKEEKTEGSERRCLLLRNSPFNPKGIWKKPKQPENQATAHSSWP